MPNSGRLIIDEVQVEEVDILRGANISLLFDTIREGAYCVDRDRRIVHWNRAAELITGYSTEEVVGSRCCDNILKHVDDQGNELCIMATSCPLHMTIGDGEVREAHVYLLHKEGRRVPVRVKTMPIRDGNGHRIGALELFDQDGVVERLRGQLLELSRVAYIDSLTGLPNRRYLDIALYQSLEEWIRYGWSFACFIADIDHFKGINDLYGHMIGDRAITTMANTMALACRSSDMIGRWGGDESLGILKNIDESRLSVLMERMCGLVRQTRIACGAVDIAATISVGATMARLGDTIESLVNRADEALYESKRKGRNQATIL